MRRRSLIAGSVSAAPGAALYRVVPEPAPAQAAPATPWHEEPLGDPEVVETTVNEDNSPLSCTAKGHDSSGNLIVRSGNISDTTATTLKKLSADDRRLIASVTQQWEEDGNEIRLTGSTGPYRPGPPEHGRGQGGILAAPPIGKPSEVILYRSRQRLPRMLRRLILQ